MKGSMTVKWLINHLQMHLYAGVRGPLSEAESWSVVQSFLQVKAFYRAGGQTIVPGVALTPQQGVRVASKVQGR